MLSANLPGRRYAIQPRHLDVKQSHIRPVLTHKINGLIATTAVSDNLVTFFLEQFTKIHPDDGLVLCDYNSGRHRCLPNCK
jgi:hypothetical protein